MRTLIVDDKKDWRWTLEGPIKKQLDWETVTADDAKAALKILESPESGIQVVVCDGLNGNYPTVAEATGRIGASFMLISATNRFIENAQSHGWPTINKDNFSSNQFIQSLREIAATRQSKEGQPTIPNHLER